MGGIYKYLFGDHQRLDGLLSSAVDVKEGIDTIPYAEFRKGLLRHIGIEEKLVLPAITRLQSGKQAEHARRIRLDHGALVALLVPPPTHGIVETIRLILKSHNSLEEGEGGLYQLMERLAGDEINDMMEKMKAFPEVPVLPHRDMPGILDVTRRAVERAGYKARF